MNSPPTSPVRPRKPPAVPHGFLSPKPKIRTVGQMTILELHDRYKHNAQTLASAGSSSSTRNQIQQLSAEQNAIKKRLVDLEGVDEIQAILRNSHLGHDDASYANLGLPSDPITTSRSIQTKQRVLAQYTPPSMPRAVSIEEAIEIERKAHAMDIERRKRTVAKKKKQGLPIKGEVLTKVEADARVWAFMNYKSTESDLENEEEVDSDDDDPSNWFEDDQDDGRKFQNIVEPDMQDLSRIIQVDYSRLTSGQPAPT